MFANIQRLEYATYLSKCLGSLLGIWSAAEKGQLWQILFFEKIPKKVATASFIKMSDLP